MKLLGDILKTLFAIYSFLSYKVVYKKNFFDGIHFDLEYKLKPRWYSPFLWLLVFICFLIVFAMNGIEGIKDLIKDWKENKDKYNSFQNSFKDNISYIKKKWILFTGVYVGF